MVSSSFTPPAAKIPTKQLFGRQPPRGPVRGFLNMLRIVTTNMHYPKTLLKQGGLVLLFAVPLISREDWYQHDGKKGAPWDRVLAEREKKQ